MIRWVLALLVAAPACAAPGPPAPSPVIALAPEDEVLAIGVVWGSLQQEKGFRSEPSPIAVFDTKRTTELRFTRGESTAMEAIELVETFKMRSGAEFRCRARAETASAAVFGRRNGIPAVELRRPALTLQRECDAPGFSEPTVSFEQTTARFMLRDERLVPFDPPLEKRTFTPIQ